MLSTIRTQTENVLAANQSLSGILQWQETKRHGPKEFFGHKPDDVLDPEYFIEADGSPRIPVGIGEAFCYTINVPRLVIRFSQSYYNCVPLATQQALSFAFGQREKPAEGYDNTLGHVEGFEYLREAFMIFYRGRFGAPKTEVSMESQNIGMHTDPDNRYEDNTFSETGRRVMETILSHKDKISKFPGIKEPDLRELIEFLGLIEGSYRVGTLIPRDVFYT